MWGCFLFMYTVASAWRGMPWSHLNFTTSNPHVCSSVIIRMNADTTGAIRTVERCEQQNGASIILAVVSKVSLSLHLKLDL